MKSVTQRRGGGEISMGRSDVALVRAIRKLDAQGHTLADVRAKIEQAARIANQQTGRSISVSGGAAVEPGETAFHGGGKRAGRGL